MKILLLDCQILQTPAFDRGMGKYTLSLLKAFIKKNDAINTYDQIHILLSENLDISKDRLNNINKHLAGNNVSKTFLNLPTDISVNMHEKYTLATEVLDSYVSNIGEANVDFLITSPFFVNFAATFPSSSKVQRFSLVYDLIPHKIWNLLRIFPDDIYFHHYQVLIGADRLFTISDAVKDDLVTLLGLPELRITDIDGGPFIRSSNKDGSEWQPKNEDYILMPSGPIVHKNNDRAVQAFEQFNKHHDNKYTLYITSDFDETAQSNLKSISKNVAFTGNISDDTLDSAYKGAAAVLFPSLAEGLGMPVLEAALDNIPVACSDRPGP